MVLVWWHIGVVMVDDIMCFGTESHCVAQAGLEPETLLLQILSTFISMCHRAQCKPPLIKALPTGSLTPMGG